jgi:hypothetical protein
MVAVSNLHSLIRLLLHQLTPADSGTVDYGSEGHGV